MKGSSNNADRSVKDKISDPTLPSSQPDSKSGAGAKYSRMLVAVECCRKFTCLDIVTNKICLSILIKK